MHIFLKVTIFFSDFIPIRRIYKMAEVVTIRAHFFGELSHFHGHDLDKGINIHVCCETCADHCWWSFSGTECLDLEAHIFEYHKDARIVYVCDINGEHNRFLSVSDFIDHLRMFC